MNITVDAPLYINRNTKNNVLHDTEMKRLIPLIEQFLLSASEDYQQDIASFNIHHMSRGGKSWTIKFRPQG